MRRWAVAGGVVLLLVVGVFVAMARSSPASVRSSAQFVPGTPEPAAQGQPAQPVQLDTTVYFPARTPAPAILLAHGFGGSKSDLDAEARSLARHGYVVLAYTARGFGRSGGLIHLDAPDYEVADASLLISYLAGLPEVQTDGAGNPRIGVAGSSYGGGLALLTAAYDHRVDAVAADITWSDLTQALFPNAAGDAPGVFKKLWAGQLFGSAAAQSGPDSSGCGRFAPDLCAGYEQAASTGQADPQILDLLRASSPASVLDKIVAPTLLSQGEQDSLFPLGQAEANARGIAANGTPVKMIWRSGGHDGGTSTTDLVRNLESWFDPVLRGRGTLDTTFDVTVPGTAISSQTGRPVSERLCAPGAFSSRTATSVALAPATTPLAPAGAPQTIYAPAGGNPAAVTSVPGLGTLLGTAASFGVSSGLGTIPGQVARFVSAPLADALLIAGSSTVQLQVTAHGADDATLFASIHILGPDGADSLPNGLVAPIELTGLTPDVPTTITVTLPGIVARVPAGQRIAVDVATTDLAYQLPEDPRSYTIALAGPSGAGGAGGGAGGAGGGGASGGGTVVVAGVDGTVSQPGQPWIWLIVGVVALGGVTLGGALAALRRRRRRAADPELADVPIAVEGLVKEYADGYRAVDGISFRVERGQVVGLLGPNGAGKTTALRVLMGLIRPTAGTVRVFGELIEAGAPVLSRIGAFIEGPGLLPHLTGRENLRLFWAATGRPEQDAEMETVTQIAGLGSSIDRRVKTFSQGMRQRLAIAQAMLGLPELLVLDEPTNGLDPPQIAEMREVLRSYADTGRTVVISSHLLAEVEQTCSHVVVMHKGKIVAVGAVADIVGSSGTQLAVDDSARAQQVLAAAGIASRAVLTRRALEDVFLELIGTSE